MKEQNSGQKQLICPNNAPQVCKKVKKMREKKYLFSTSYLMNIIMNELSQLHNTIGSPLRLTILRIKILNLKKVKFRGFFRAFAP